MNPERILSGFFVFFNTYKGCYKTWNLDRPIFDDALSSQRFQMGIKWFKADILTKSDSILAETSNQ